MENDLKKKIESTIEEIQGSNEYCAARRKSICAKLITIFRDDNDLERCIEELKDLNETEFQNLIRITELKKLLE